MKSSLSSFELKHIISELQFLVGAKVEKIFQQEKPTNDLLFSLHVPGKGKNYLFFSLPDAICLSSFKPVFPLIPPSFCSSLRRKITNAKILSIVQHGFERIFVINFSTKYGPSSLIVELFSSGNIILVNKENIILATLHQKIWNENRKILHGKTYNFPSEQINPSLLNQKEFDELLQKSTKDTLVTFLAIDCSLGGTYAEYIISKTDYVKSQHPSLIKSSTELLNVLRNLFKQETHAVSTGEEVFPIAVKEGTPFNTFNEAVASLLLKNLEAQEYKELTKSRTASLSKFDKIISTQTHQQEGLEKSAKQNQKAGELIYSNYQEVKGVLDQIKSLKKYCSWDEIRLELKKYPFVKSINEHKGQVQVELK